MTPARVSLPLPECQRCERPTKRSTWERLAGLCTACHGRLQRSVVQLELGGQ